MATASLHHFLLLVLLPTWLLIGLSDWWCHRKSLIERTSGVKESVLHLGLSLQAGAAITAGLFMEINAPVLVFIVVCLIVHEITTSLDVHIAIPERRFTWIEQRIHDFLTAIPFAAVLLVCATHLDQVQGIFGWSEADWALRWKEEPLPIAYLIGWNVAALVLNIGPYSEELLRCIRSARSAKTAVVGPNVRPEPI